MKHRDGKPKAFLKEASADGAPVQDNLRKFSRLPVVFDHEERILKFLADRLDRVTLGDCECLKLVHL